MHKRIRPYRRTLSVCDSSNVYRLSLVGTFELANHFRIRYNIFFDPRCLCNTALTPIGAWFPAFLRACSHSGRCCYASAKVHIIFETKEDFEEKDKINRDLSEHVRVAAWFPSLSLNHNPFPFRFDDHSIDSNNEAFRVSCFKMRKLLFHDKSIIIL